MDSKVIRELLENGVHFGHQTNKWNPKMGKFIFGEKSGIYIIDLEKTEEALAKAVEFLYGLTSEGKTVLFVGTKKQAKQIIRDEAQRCEMFFVEERWLGGCLTNFTTIRKSVDRLNELEEMKTGEIYQSLAKKEKAHIDRESHKLLKNLEGVRNMDKLPDCLIVVDAEAENIAIKEARKIDIPIVALVDTTCDPNIVDYPIPGNDDAIRAISYIVSTLADAVKKGHSEFSRGEKEETSEETSSGDEAAIEIDQTSEAVQPGENTDSDDKPEKKEEIAVEPHPAKPREKPAPRKQDKDEVVEGDIKLDDE